MSNKVLFNKVDTVCYICGTPLTSPNDRCIGDKFYCADDYQRELEKVRNKEKLRANERFRKNFKGFGGEL